MFVNLGDKRAGSSAPGTTSGMGGKPQGDRTAIAGSYTKAHFGRRKSKQMLPHRYIIGCEDGLADPDGIGWVVSDYVWSKLSSLPESVTDRCQDKHEYVFQMAKSEHWFSGIDEVREPNAAARASGRNALAGQGTMRPRGTSDVDQLNPLGRTPGSVWPMSSEALVVSEEIAAGFNLPTHYAAFPQELPRRAILGWSPSAICLACGEGRRPVIDKNPGVKERDTPRYCEDARHGAEGSTLGNRGPSAAILGYACACTPSTSHPGIKTDQPRNNGEGWAAATGDRTIPSGGYGGPNAHPKTGPWIEYHLDGWTPPPARPSVVLDPFCGTGTTAGVARALGRVGIGLDLSHDYLRLARWRVERSGHFSKTEQRTHKERQGSLL